MKLTHLGAASALVLGLAICGAAAAQTATNNAPYGEATATAVKVSGLNNNSIGSSNNNSNQGNDYSQTNGNAVGSKNTWKSGNTSMHDSQNNNSNQGNDYSNNSNQNNSVNIGVKLNLTDQTLSSSVSDVSFNSGEGVHEDNRSITTGALSYSGGAFQGWAGIQTANNNTGVASNNLAATSVSANANASFGGANGGSK
jgi:hypothetical protein